MTALGGRSRLGVLIGLGVVLGLLIGVAAGFLLAPRWRTNEGAAVAATAPGTAPFPGASATPTTRSASPSPSASSSPSASASPSAAARSASPSPTRGTTPTPGAQAPSGGTVTVVAVGDIACDPNSSSFHGGTGTASNCHQMATSDVALSLHPDVALPLGDTQYEDGTAEGYARSYAPSWGRLLSISRPAVGNHEYLTSHASAYFDYFGAAAGERDKGYYSFDAGSWHLISLNSNCSQAGGCKADSPQGRWLAADLAAHPTQCVLAYFHHPRWSHGEHGDNDGVAPFISTLYAAGAEVVLSGHDHDYERFTPLTPDGAPDPARGVRQFVVGSGGRNHYRTTTGATTEAMNADTFGVLQLTLRPGAYDWRFVPEAGGSYTDSGSANCH